MISKQHLAVQASGLLFAATLLAAEGIPGDGTDLRTQTKTGVVAVDCNAGGSLAEAVARRTGASTFWFTGTCREETPVVIERNHVTLRGIGPDPTIEGGGLVVRSALGVVLRDFTVRGVADDYAITVVRNAEVDASGIIGEESMSGFVVEDAVADISDSTFRNNVLDGLVNQGGRLFLRGRITAHDNGFLGIITTGGGSINSKDATDLEIEARANFIGFVVQFASSVTLPDVRLAANENMVHGVLVASQGILGIGGELEASDNGAFGMAIGDTGNWTQFIGVDATTTVTGNGQGGILAVNGGNLSIVTATTIEGNGGPGLIADDSAVTINNTEVRDNQGADVFLAFGTTASFGDGNVFATPVVCQDPVWTRGTAGCDVQASRSSEFPDSSKLRALLDPPRMALRTSAR